MTNDTLQLVAVDGRAFPREDIRHRLIDGTDAAPNEVPNTAYYRRALLRGDVRTPVAVSKKGA